MYQNAAVAIVRDWGYII